MQINNIAGGSQQWNTFQETKHLNYSKNTTKTHFTFQHALTVEAVMKWYANELGYGNDAQYWGIVGLLHDIDFELYPEQHCIKAPELLREGGVSEDIIHGVFHTAMALRWT